MTSKLISSLPQDWQSWIHDNLARGCEPGGMLDIMVREGRFERTLAEAALEEARCSDGRGALARQARPEIDTTGNSVPTPDRVVHVLFSLAVPRVVLLGNVLSAEECDALCAYTEQRLQRSPVVADGGGNEVHPHRSSRGAMLARGETELVDRIERRLAALAQWPLERGEGLQVLRYEKGDEYRPHYDWFDPALPGPRRHMEHGGQRVGTIVIYLSDVTEGGGTAFPSLGLEVQPRKGNAVFFANTDPFGRPDPKTLHAGSPVMRGVKYIATKWLRERTY